jgi:hypothetical protein
VSSYARSLELVAALEAAGVHATADPRSATPPVVLVTPPDRVFDITCGYTARWNLYALAPGSGNADAHKLLDAMVDDLAELLPLETADPASYVLTPDQPPFAAYRCQFTEGISS